MTEYVLTPDELAMLENIAAQIRMLQADSQAILRTIARIQGLSGSFVLRDGKLIQEEG